MNVVLWRIDSFGPKLKDFADDRLEFDENVRKSSKWVEVTNFQQFSFFLGVFIRLELQMHENQGLFGKGLTLSSIYTNFSTLKKKALRKHCGKRSNCSK